MANTSKGLTRIVKAMGYSKQGFCAAWKYEEAFRQELILAVILAPLAVWLSDAPVEMALMLGSLLLVLIVEILNSAVEAVVDRFGEDWHDLAGRAKDMASAAVTLSLLNVVVIWAVLLMPKFV